MNIEIVEISGIHIEIVRKKIKNLHVGVYPPEGRVRVAAPEAVSDDAIRLAVLTRMSWLKRKQAEFASQERQSSRRYVSGETHFLFGRSLRLAVTEWDKKVHRIARAGTDRLQMTVPRGSDEKARRQWMQNWYKAELKKFAAPRIETWAERIGVGPEKWGARLMKTKWGSCNPSKRIIWLNTELAKKPEAAIDYVIVHELAHFISARHDEKFIAVLDRELPFWRQTRQHLNALPLDAWR